ncbi:nuclear transport factor 2 family protein [Flavihumibacter rivuli]|uniref:nuclear transport factor 2 family protein n=1 Tax=Flavihumibacter rivuli TaxID=2838156 RepID=UPI001BDF21BC|nr:nuclear transport factor 2 family protein [Flavihumibacter rivuli]ULQ56011.1 nuclear transport factor 2 family protein [Flavihumibacter rivuli]
MPSRETIIKNYISAYNQSDVTGMLTDLADDIVFENIQNGETTLLQNGIEAFRAQAEQALAYFTERRQTITAIRHEGDRTEIDISYHAVLAMDFPNGLRKGQAIELSGKSIFAFKGDKVIRLTDIS